MIPLSIDSLILTLSSYPTWVLDILMMLICGFFQLFLLRFIGLAGLYLYVAVSVIAGNIQVLKASHYFLYESPIALGTVIFTSLFLCTEIIREFYGKEAARRSIFIGFFGYFMMTSLMILTLGYKNVDPTLDTFHFIAAHHHIKALFSPSLSIFTASIIAYVAGHNVDIWVYEHIMKLTKGKYLWLRTNVASFISIFIDNFTFSYLAWIFFAPTALEFDVVFHTYILGVYVVRMLITVFNTPFMYLARKIHSSKAYDQIS